MSMREYAETLGRRVAEQNLFLSLSDYGKLNEEELVNALSAINTKSCMGVAVAAIDSVAVREAIDALVQKGVGAVTLVSDVTWSLRFDSKGPNNVAAGRLAASLVGRFWPHRMISTPSIRPASISSCGMVLMYWRSRNVPKHAECRVAVVQSERRDSPRSMTECRFKSSSSTTRSAMAPTAMRPRSSSPR